MTTLYDFLFIDTARIYSLYAQLFDGLHEATDKIANEVTTKHTAAQLGGDPIGKLGYERKKDLEEGISTRLVPHDLLLRDVLIGLKERNFICEDPLSAKSGNIIHLKGEIAVVNLDNLAQFIEKAPVFFEGLLAQEAGAELRTLTNQQIKAYKKEKNKQSTIITELLVAITGLMPQTVQFVLKGESITAWASVNQKSMRVELKEINVQGPSLYGEWNLLGIVDIPANVTDSATPELPDVYQGIYDMLKGVNEIIALPQGDIRVTPLLIYREIKGN